MNRELETARYVMNILELTRSLMSAASSPSQNWCRVRFISQWCHRMVSRTEQCVSNTVNGCGVTRLGAMAITRYPTFLNLEAMSRVNLPNRHMSREPLFRLRTELVALLSAISFLSGFS